EDYHSIKDDIPLVSVYTTRNVLVRAKLIPNAFLTKEIRATDDIKEYEMVFMNVDVPLNQPQPSSGEEEEANCWRIKFTIKIVKDNHPTDGGGESEADDGDEYIKALCLLRGGAVKDGCDVFDVKDMWDLLRDGPEYGDDGADDENPSSDDDEYSDNSGDDGSGDDGGGATIH
ncbi:hypothetical protein Tco_1136752, partial [Tanacetum coccineum]